MYITLHAWCAYSLAKFMYIPHFIGGKVHNYLISPAPIIHKSASESHKSFYNSLVCTNGSKHEQEYEWHAYDSTRQCFTAPLLTKLGHYLCRGSTRHECDWIRQPSNNAELDREIHLQRNIISQSYICIGKSPGQSPRHLLRAGAQSSPT